MKDYPAKILLVEDNRAEVELVQEFLSEVNSTSFLLTSACCIREALIHLHKEKFEVILLDLSLPDSQGLETVTQVQNQAPTIPILVLSVLRDETVALKAVRQGAQDYLIKGEFDSGLLIRAINYAMARQKIAEALRQQAEREKLLSKILDKIRQSLDLKEILQTTVTEVREFLNTDRVLICNYISEQSGVVVVESVGCEDQTNDARCIWNPRVRAALDILEYKSLDAISVQQQKQVEASTPNLSIDLLAKGILTTPIWQSECLVPMANGNGNGNGNGNIMLSTSHKLWGMLIAHHYSAPRQWQQWEVDFLKHLASQVAVAIQQAELLQQLEIANHELQRIACKDGLTGVANRRQFDQFLAQEWRRLIRSQQPLSLILCDIDFFKLYNDYYGHPAGDTCLRKVAQTLKKVVKRPHDLVARYGGEEFAIVLPATDINGAMVVAREIHQQLHSLKIPHLKSPVQKYVTLSLGVASVIPDQLRYPEALVKIADQMLYQAKQQGRDQICTQK